MEKARPVSEEEKRRVRYRNVRDALKEKAQLQDWLYVEGFITWGDGEPHERCWLEKGGVIDVPTTESSAKHCPGPKKPGDEAWDKLWSVFTLGDYERLPLCGTDNPEYAQAKKDAESFIPEPKSPRILHQGD